MKNTNKGTGELKTLGPLMFITGLGLVFLAAYQGSSWIICLPLAAVFWLMLIRASKKKRQRGPE